MLPDFANPKYVWQNFRLAKRLRSWLYSCMNRSASFIACLLIGSSLPSISTAQTKAEKTPLVNPGMKIVSAARSQIGKTVYYDPSYVGLAYPNGDVPMDRGVCTDVVIRALRSGVKQDLQKALHEDMKANFSTYPNNWNLKRPDKNIDHRRVPNLEAYFKRQGFNLKVTQDAKDYLPGDLVTCSVPPIHIMVVSDKRSADGTPLVIHNIGSGTKEEDRLFSFKLLGHYRLK